MSDKYVERQIKFYESATSKDAENDALYRLGTPKELEAVPCNGNANLTAHIPHPQVSQSVISDF